MLLRNKTPAKWLGGDRLQTTKLTKKAYFFMERILIGTNVIDYAYNGPDDWCFMRKVDRAKEITFN